MQLQDADLEIMKQLGDMKLRSIMSSSSTASSWLNSNWTRTESSTRSTGCELAEGMLAVGSSFLWITTLFFWCGPTYLNSAVSRGTCAFVFFLLSCRILIKYLGT